MSLLLESVGWRADDEALVVVLEAWSLLTTEHTVFDDSDTGCSLLHTLDLRLDAVDGVQVRGWQFATSFPLQLVPYPFM